MTRSRDTVPTRSNGQGASPVTDSPSLTVLLDSLGSRPEDLVAQLALLPTLVNSLTAIGHRLEELEVKLAAGKEQDLLLRRGEESAKEADTPAGRRAPPETPLAVDPATRRRRETMLWTPQAPLTRDDKRKEEALDDEGDDGLLRCRGMIFRVQFGDMELKQQAVDKLRKTELEFSGEGSRKLSDLLHVLWEWRNLVEAWNYGPRTAWNLLRYNLSGRARTLIQRHQNWKDGVTALLTLYATEEEQERLRAALFKMQRAPTETGYEFAFRLSRHASPFYPTEVTDADLWRYLLIGLGEQWVLTNAAVHVLLAQDADAGREFCEALQRLQTHADRLPQVPRRVNHVESTPKPAPKGQGNSNNRNNNNNNNNININNNKDRELRRKQGLCFECGSKDHKASFHRTGGSSKDKDNVHHVGSAVEVHKVHLELHLVSGELLECELDSGTVHHLIPLSIIQDFSLEKSMRPSTGLPA